MTNKAKIKEIAKIAKLDYNNITDMKVDTTTILYFFEKDKHFCWKSKKLDILQAIEINKLLISN